MTATEVKLVAVVPATEHAARARLFDALEQAFPVRFEGRAPTELGAADAAVLVGAGSEAERRAGDAGLPHLVALGPEPGAGEAAGPVDLARDGKLDHRLRGQRLVDAVAPAARAVPAETGLTILASHHGSPVWVARDDGPTRRDVVAFAPAELAPGECLRGRIQEGRALALLALVHFVRELTATIDFRPPPLRATFLLDDPNLHWTSYGHLRYPEIVRHADEHDYHVAMAMVPLDAWGAHPVAVRLFRERSERVSLMIHGNDHVLEELARPRPPEDGRALLAQGLRRSAAFQRRTGVRVARVITAPHGDCSEQMARDMLRLGYHGLCIGRPFPWAARVPESWLTSPAAASPLAAFGPATLVAGGLPVLLRRPFDLSPGDLALRAYLDQPLILYGHHEDLEEGLDPFAEWAERVRALGRARWVSPGEMAATNHATRVAGQTLHVRMHSRTAGVELPEGVERLRVELPPGDTTGEDERVVLGSDVTGGVGEELPLARGARRAEVSLVRADALDPSAVPAPSWTPWPLARRLAGEGRDRLAPLYRRASRKSARRDRDGLPVESSARATTL